MGRRTLIALLFASACSGGPDRQPIVRPDGGQFCTAGSHTCPGGTRCMNSYCVPTCAAGAQCPEGTVCLGTSFPDDVCAPITPVSCTSTNQCPVAQVCLSGHCVSGEAVGDGGLESCTVNGLPDKCAPDAVCYVVNGGPICVGLPLCGADGGCPSGAISQACNLMPDGGRVIPGKAPVCPLEECGTSSDCFPNATCFRRGLVPWGRCQFGGTNEPCFSDADCASAAKCDNPGPDGGSEDGGVPGMCRCVITTPDAGVCAQ